MRTPPDPALRARSFSRPALRFVVVLLVLWGALLAALPYAIGFGLKRWLTDHGAQAVELADVDFNLFTGRLGLTGLTVIVDGTRVLALPRGAVQVAWGPLLERRVRVRSLTLGGLYLGFQQRPDGTWRGPLPRLAEAPEEAPAGARSADWGFGLDAGSVTGAEVAYADGAGAHILRIESLDVAELATWHPGRPAHVTVVGILDGAPVRVEGDMTPFAAAPKAVGRVLAQDVVLEGFPALAAAPMRRVAGRLALDLKVRAERAGNATSVVQEGTVTLSDVALETADAQVAAEGLAWDGTVTVTAPDGGPPHWEAEGRLEAGPGTVDVPAADLRAAPHRVTWRGRLAADAPGAPPEAAGEIRLEGLRVDLPARGVRLVAVQEAALEGLAVAPTGAVDLESGHLTGLVVGTDLEPPEGSARPPLLSAASVQVDGAARDAGGGLAAKAVRVEAAEADLERTADGRFRLIGNRLERLAAAPEGKAGAEAEAPDAGPGAPPVRIGRLSVTGDSRVRLTDRTVEPLYRAEAHVTELRVEGLDSGDPEAAARVALGFRLGDYSEVSARGAVKPFAPRPDVDLKGTVRRLELPPFSVYTAGLVGYNVTTGQLDADVDLRLRGGTVDGTARLTLRKLALAPGDKRRMDRVARDLTMPLDAALALLRDRDDTIKLDLPVSGDLDDPSVDVGGIVSQALGRGMKVAAITYAKIALQPFGAMVAVVQLAGKAAALRLDPVEYPPGSAAIDARAAAYAERVARLMEARPQLVLQLCGSAVPADREALAVQAPRDAGPPAPEAAAAPPAEPGAGGVSEVSDERLMALARARAEAFRDTLVRDHKVAPERLLICRPALEPGAKAAPRVDLLI